MAAENRPHSFPNVFHQLTCSCDASAFGVGTVTLSHASGSTWTAEFTVDGSTVTEDGEQSVSVTATNQYDNTATNETGTLVVDTTPPGADAETLTVSAASTATPTQTDLARPTSKEREPSRMLGAGLPLVARSFSSC